VSNARLNAVRALLSQTSDGVDAVVVSDIVNIAYISGFTGSTALLLITADETLFITDFRYTGQARRQCPDFEIVDISKSDSLDDLFSSRPSIKRLGFESANVTVARLEGWKKRTPIAEWISVGESLSQLRMIKDSDEIALINHAISIAQDGFSLVSPLLEPGVTEAEFALELEFAMRRAGASGASFDIIVASGENGAYPHHRAGDRAFENGDLVTIDWGAKYQGYCSDITRTVIIGPNIGDKQKEIYDIVAQAKQLSIEAIKPGVTGKEIDSIARDYIAEHGYGDYFGHSLGHSLGLEVHDGATLSQRAENVILVPGMVTTVEPGIYIEGFGGVRLEEDVLVTETGSVVLTIPSPPLTVR
jgi:Xaa-Pro aminopeptidase